MELGNYLEKLEKRSKVSQKGIHSFLHEVTWEVCKYVGEPKKFGMWLGVVKRYGAGRMRSLLQYLKDNDIKNPKYVLACTRQKTREK